MHGTAAIETRGLTKWFGEHRGIEHVTLDVERGEVFGLLGPNGAGKSTAIRLLLGLIKATGGESRVLELDAWRQRRAIHRRVGVLPGDFAYENSLTGREVIAFFNRLRGTSPDGRVDALAERLHADLDRPQRDLSRGNHQKIGLVIALAHDPELLIFDEPTGGLDPLMQEEFLRILGELRERGRTVLLSSHNMAEVERACDRVAMIHEGRLLAVETIASLLDRAPKEMRIVFDRPADPAAFSSIGGVRAARADGNTLTLRVAGDIDAVVRKASEQHIVDLLSERPSLEQAFVQLYEASDGAGDESPFGNGPGAEA